MFLDFENFQKRKSKHYNKTKEWPNRGAHLYDAVMLQWDPIQVVANNTSCKPCQSFSFSFRKFIKKSHWFFKGGRGVGVLPHFCELIRVLRVA